MELRSILHDTGVQATVCCVPLAKGQLLPPSAAGLEMMNVWFWRAVAQSQLVVISHLPSSRLEGSLEICKQCTYEQMFEKLTNHTVTRRTR